MSIYYVVFCDNLWFLCGVVGLHQSFSQYTFCDMQKMMMIPLLWHLQKTGILEIRTVKGGDKISKTIFIQKHNRHVVLFLYTVLHFLVDLSCIYFLIGMMIPRFDSHEKWLLLAVFYNILAFALPMVLGLLADLWNKNYLISALGCLLVAMGYLCYRLPFPAVFLLGIGNGLFHIGGGKQIMEESRPRYASSGIFISSGALGVYLGSLWGSMLMPLWRIFLGIMVAAAIPLWFLHRGSDVVAPASEFSEPHEAEYMMHVPFFHFALAMIALIFVVCIRSYYGSILNYSWKSGIPAGLIFTLCIVGGKFTGGILADHLGVWRATLVSLGAAAILGVFSFASPVCGCLSICFFNMTMPITLSLMGQLLPHSQGFAFGILMFALFLGTLPTMLGRIDLFFSPWGLFGLCTISLISLLWEIHLCQRRLLPSGAKGGTCL